MFDNIFDASHYRSQNPDLANAGLVTDEQLYQHFISYGLNEGRQFSRFADLSYYRQMNPDLEAAGLATNTDLYNHLVAHGTDENRNFSRLLDIDFYLQDNPDVAQAFGGNRGLAFQHLQQHGFAEGRRFSTFADVDEYLLNNPDVNRFYEGDREQAFLHMQENGISEKRRLSNYVDLDYYLQQNQDVNAAFGGNGIAAFDHLKTHGLAEGRRFDPKFDTAFYAEANPDLAIAGITTPKALFTHFIQYGSKEGRSAIPNPPPLPQAFDEFTNPGAIASEWKASFYRWDGQGSPDLADFDESNRIGTTSLGSNQRTDGNLGLEPQNWGVGSPLGDSRLPSDNFILMTQTRANLTAGQTYTLRVAADDGYRIWAHKVGGDYFNITPNADINVWQKDAYSPKTIEFTAPESGLFDLHAQMFEQRGNTYFDLSWAPDNSATAGSASPFSTTEYYERLYKNTDATINQELAYDSEGVLIHDGISSTDNDADSNGYNVHALVGGEVIEINRNGQVLSGVNEQHDLAFHPVTGRRVRASDSNNKVVIYNPDLNQRFTYLHFSSVADLEVGSRVNPGDVLGVEGSTGLAMGRATHLSVKTGTAGGFAQDPRDALGVARSEGVLDKAYR